MTLVAFNFDETLTQSDPSLLLGSEYDVATEVRGLVEQGLQEETSFETSLRQRVKLLEGMPEQEVETAFDRLKLRDGAAELLTDLQRSDVPVAIVTGSFERAVDAALQNAGVAVDHVVANRLVVENGALTGEVEGALLEPETDRALTELATAEGVALEDTFAVGNGAIDLRMLQTAGTAIGYDPEPVAEQYCDVVVTSMRRLRLYFEQHGLIDSDTR